MRSINGLPSNYTGKLNLLLNDINIPNVCRNIVLLLIMGNVSDETTAADIALHFWYSVFMPGEYRLQITAILTKFLADLHATGGIGTPLRLGPQSLLYLTVPQMQPLFQCLKHFISSDTPVAVIQDEYDRVRTAPTRRDLRDRMYAGLRPSHRVAFQEFRRFGIVLPFGSMNAHFNSPNLSLFSLDMEWLQTDYADPLEGWE